MAVWTKPEAFSLAETGFVLIEAIGGVWGWDCLDTTVRFRVIAKRQLTIDRKCQSA